MHSRPHPARRSTLARHPFGRSLRIESLEDRSLLAGVELPSNLAAALVDDSYEQNDTRATARSLGTLTSSQTINNLVQADANDWYRFTTTRTGSSASSVSLAFLHSQGDLDLELYNSAGTRLRVSQGINNTESVSLGGLAAGTYYIRVYGYRGVTNPNYGLGINLPASALVEDSYENNDTLAMAYNLGTLTTNASLNNLALADSADWFRFTTTATGTTSNAVSLSFQNAQGNLALQLYNSTGSLLATSNGIGNAESLSLANRAAGTYYARVYSATGGTNPGYSLQIVAPTSTTTTPTPAPGAFDIQIAYSGFTASQRAIFEQAAGKWESIIVGDLPSATYNGIVVDDLLINASSTALDGVGGTLGQAGYDRARTSGTQLPYHGSMEFDTADLASMEANGTLLSVITHEIGHVLGIGTLWQAKGLLSGAGTSNPLFTGTQATAAYNAIFGVNAAGVPVENSGGSGTRDSHWRESTFNNEIMTGYVNSGSNPLSRVTVGSLADIGYSVNMAAADAYTRPGGSVSLVSAGEVTSGAGLLAADPSQDNSNDHEPADAEAAINGGFVRFGQQARNLWSSLVLDYLNQSSVTSRRTSASATTVSQQPMASPWSAAVDLLLAGETDLLCDPAT
jgi:hypothetical protein